MKLVGRNELSHHIHRHLLYSRGHQEYHFADDRRERMMKWRDFTLESFPDLQLYCWCYMYCNRYYYYYIIVKDQIFCSYDDLRLNQQRKPKKSRLGSKTSVTKEQIWQRRLTHVQAPMRHIISHLDVSYWRICVFATNHTARQKDLVALRASCGLISVEKFCFYRHVISWRHPGSLLLCSKVS